MEYNTPFCKECKEELRYTMSKLGYYIGLIVVVSIIFGFSLGGMFITRPL